MTLMEKKFSQSRDYDTIFYEFYESRGSSQSARDVNQMGLEEKSSVSSQIHNVDQHNIEAMEAELRQIQQISANEQIDDLGQFGQTGMSLDKERNEGEDGDNQVLDLGGSKMPLEPDDEKNDEVSGGVSFERLDIDNLRCSEPSVKNSDPDQQQVDQKDGSEQHHESQVQTGVHVLNRIDERTNEESKIDDQSNSHTLLAVDEIGLTASSNRYKESEEMIKDQFSKPLVWQDSKPSTQSDFNLQKNSEVLSGDGE